MTLEHVDPFSIPTSITTTPLMTVVPQVSQAPGPLDKGPKTVSSHQPDAEPEMKVQMDVDTFNDPLNGQDDTHSTQSMTSLKEQVAPILQNPQQCLSLLDLCLEKQGVVTTLPPEVQSRLARSLQDQSLALKV
jgi:hypothetical protein